MLKIILVALLPLVILFGLGLNGSLTSADRKGDEAFSGTLEKMVPAGGTASMDLNLSQLGTRRSKMVNAGRIGFDLEGDSFFSVLVFNGELRGPIPSSMRLIPRGLATLPGKLGESYENLVIESMPVGSPFEFTIRDGRTGFVFFNIEGHQFDYVANDRSFSIQMGRLLLSEEFATELGRTSDANNLVGQISIRATMRPIEVTQIVEGETQSSILKADPETGNVPGPDVIVGDLPSMQQFNGPTGTKVGLAVGTDSCNAGTIDLNWVANPSNDHPVIPQNLYRMSGGANNDERFEQIGQSSVKHAFTALTQNICSFGCNGVGGSRLGSGCSDPYSASLNAGPSLGSRAWINPFTGFYPRNDSATPNNFHTGHDHSGAAHKILTEIVDLRTDLNPGATYYAEGQYITPHEYVWCQANPGQCNMNNNVSYRRFNVVGTASPFAFSPAAATVRTKPAVSAWPGASTAEIKPDSAADGIGSVSYKVTNPSPGVWRYEYAVYNQNMDRAIQSFSVPVGSGATLSNLGFHAPPQQPGWTGDGTVGNAGFSNAAWTPVQGGGAVTWSSETFAANPNANAIRWGTLYNFRFDSNRPPQNVNATIGFFKTGSPINVQVQGPSAIAFNVSVSGRVTDGSGMGMGNVTIFLTDSLGVTRSAVSNPFGFFGFPNVLTGSYTVGAMSKRYTFAAPTTMVIADNVTGLNFSPLP